ncbi:MAG: ABC transporter ATP-binding protein [Lutibacter sp.]|nr:ABC transporter ATP-binding protein [Lutibacter sp.]MDP3944990.1 ABC transporter ATP-binding protein [Lutibacter sp.]
MTKWKFIKESIKENPGLAALAVISGFCYNIFTVLVPIAIGRFYEFNFEFSSVRLKLFFSGFPFIYTNSFNAFLILFIGIILIRFLFEYSNRYVIGILGERFSKSLREQLFAHQLRIHTTIYDEKGIGRYLLRYSGDLKSVQNYLTQGIFRFAQDMLLIAILITVIGYYSVNMALIILTFIVCAFGFIFFMNLVLYRISVERRNRRSGMLAFVNNALRSILPIKVFNKNVPFENRYNKRSLKLLDIGVKYQHITALINAIIPFITYLMVGITMLYIYSLKNAGIDFDRSSFLILILLIISFLSIFRRILTVNIVWKLGNISFEKLIAVFMLKTESTSYKRKIKIYDEAIVFKNVVYNTEISNNESPFNLKIEPYSISYLKSSAGSGNSLTFIKLLLKIYNPSEGVIYFGKYAANKLSEKAIRKQITVVSAKIPLVGNTVFEAISYSRNPEKKLQCEKVLHELQQFVPKSQQLTLSSKIGEQSNGLNDSQKQLLLWCRALLANKPILILHFPFDYINENLKKHLLQSILDWKGQKTIIFIDEKFPEGLKVDKLYEL